MTRGDPKATPKPIPHDLDIDTYRLHLAGRTLVSSVLAAEREEARARQARQREARRRAKAETDQPEETNP